MTIQTIPTMLLEQRRNHNADVCNKLGYVLHGQLLMLITNFSFGILLPGRVTRETQYTNVKELSGHCHIEIWMSIFTKIQSVFAMIDNSKWPYIPHLKKRGLRP